MITYICCFFLNPFQLNFPCMRHVFFKHVLTCLSFVAIHPSFVSRMLTCPATEMVDGSRVLYFEQV